MPGMEERAGQEGKPPAGCVTVKEGNPGFTAAVILLLVAAAIVFALVEAQRLSF